MSVVMECGHAANATTADGQPACAICAGINEGALVVESNQPDLRGRLAKCSCGRVEDSIKSLSGGLAFFEYRGEGTRAAGHCKHCGYYECAHDPDYMETLVHGRDGTRRKTVVERGKCPGYEAHGAWDTDTFYCGCRGWD